jgi:hypothetical protein
MSCPECRDTGWVTLFTDRSRCKQGCLPPELRNEISEPIKNDVKEKDQDYSGIKIPSKGKVTSVTFSDSGTTDIQGSLTINGSEQLSIFQNTSGNFTLSTSNTANNFTFQDTATAGDAFFITGNSAGTGAGGTITIRAGEDKVDSIVEASVFDDPRWRKIYDCLVNMNLDKVADPRNLRMTIQRPDKSGVWGGRSDVEMSWLKTLQELLEEGLGEPR